MPSCNHCLECKLTNQHDFDGVLMVAMEEWADIQRRKQGLTTDVYQAEILALDIKFPHCILATLAEVIYESSMRFGSD